MRPRAIPERQRKMFTKCLKKKEVRLEVKREVKLFELHDTTRPQTIVHEQGSLTPTNRQVDEVNVSELTSSLTPNLTPHYINTELCIDLKTILTSDRRAKMRKDYTGVLTRDGREHYTFIETPASTDGKRNPHVFEGEFITITRRSDGSLRPNFKNLTTGRGFSVESYAFGVAYELREALSSLIEED